MRTQLVVGAQKLYLSLQDSVQFARDLLAEIQDQVFSFDVAVCPSFINLAHVAEILRGTVVGVGAQNVHQEDNGAFTGQVSIRELLHCGVTYVTVGHSELRKYQHETNGQVNQKVKTCLRHGVIPIACVGEHREDRDKGRSCDVIREDIGSVIDGVLSESLPVENVVIAYEPVWAIKAGRDDKKTVPATPQEASEMHDFIRRVLAESCGRNAAQQMRIIYGGSVSQENAADLLTQPSIDGLLIGTASIRIQSFLHILEAAQAAGPSQRVIDSV